MKKREAKRITKRKSAPRPKASVSAPVDSQWISIASAMSTNTSKMIDVNQRIIERLDVLDRGVERIRARLSGEDSVMCFVWGIIRVDMEIRFPIEGVHPDVTKRIVVLNIAAAPKRMRSNEEAVFRIDPMMGGLSGALYLEGPFAFVDVQVGMDSMFMSSSPSDGGDPPAAKEVVFGTVRVGQRITARVRRIDP
jgi:hypothetical protein